MDDGGVDEPGVDDGQDAPAEEGHPLGSSAGDNADRNGSSSVSDD